MGTKLVAVQRYYKGNTIEGYDIQDLSSNEIRQFKTDELKSMIAQRKLNVANLKLTSDNRLILITDDKKINDNINYDGRSDNEVTIHGVEVDKLVYEMLKDFDSRTVSVKVKSFDKDRNTFVIKFRDGRVIQNSLEMLFKYRVEPGYKPITQAVALEFIPIAVRFRGKTHSIDKLDGGRANENRFILDVHYVDYGGELRDSGSSLENYSSYISGMITFTLNKLLERDEKASLALRLFAKTGVYESEDRAEDRTGLITSSAITYGIMYALVIGSNDPLMAAAITATSGSLLNGMVQCTRWMLK